LKKSSLIIIAALAFPLVFGSIGCAKTVAKTGDTVQVTYTLTLTDGKQIDTNVGAQPLEVTLGQGQLIPGFENAVIGMKVGEKKTVRVLSADAYGPYSDNLVADVPRAQMPPELNPKVGDTLQMGLPDGSMRLVTVLKVTGTSVTVDMNNPLAGKDLVFDIELVKIL
jgi:peptidylprolyl isomerase